MRIRYVQLFALLVAIFIAQPVFGQGRKGQCQDTEMLNDKELGVILTKYNEARQRDFNQSCKMLEISVYHSWNAQIRKVLGKYGCSWGNLQSFNKVKTKEDICLSGDLELVPLVSPDEKKKPKPRPAAKKCDMGKVSQLALGYAKFFKEAASRCNKAELKKFGLWNKELDALLKRHHCSWADFKGLKKVETLADLGCKKQVRPHPAVTIAKAPPEEGYSYWKTWVGGGVGVAGLILLGTGVGFGLQADGYAKEAQSEPIQLEVQRLNREAADNANTANILLGFGGGLIAVGAAVVLLDLVVWESPGDTSPAKSSASVGIGPGSVYLKVPF